MLTNPKGWRNRWAAAKVRKMEMERRREINAVRWKSYSLKEGQTNSEPVNEEAPAVQEDPTDKMTNAELREALSQFEVPKTTARARLIELYRDHVLNAGE